MPKTNGFQVPAEHPSGDARFVVIDKVLKRTHYSQDALIEVLNTAQETFGHLAEDLLIYVAQQLKLPRSWVYGVASFYHIFSLKPPGDHQCLVCLGTACYVKHAAEIIAQVQQTFQVAVGDTTPDGKLSFGTARCLGTCGLAPVVVIDEAMLGHETPASVLAQLHAVLEGRKTMTRTPMGSTFSERELEEELQR